MIDSVGAGGLIDSVGSGGLVDSVGSGGLIDGVGSGGLIDSVGSGELAIWGSGMRSGKDSYRGRFGARKSITPTKIFVARPYFTSRFPPQHDGVVIPFGTAFLLF